MAYASTIATLAMLEFRVHVDPASFDSKNPPALVLVTAEIEDAAAMALGAPLSADWRDYPAPTQLATIRDAWIANAVSIALIVPSALLPTIVPERNVHIDTRHLSFANVAWQAHAFQFDPRLLT